MHSRPCCRTGRHLITEIMEGVQLLVGFQLFIGKQSILVLWQTIHCLRGKRSNFSSSTKDPSGSIFSDKNEIPSRRWREYFEDLFEPSKGHQ